LVDQGLARNTEPAGEDVPNVWCFVFATFL
jgi:hypothetical protein